MSRPPSSGSKHPQDPTGLTQTAAGSSDEGHLVTLEAPPERPRPTLSRERTMVGPAAGAPDDDTLIAAEQRKPQPQQLSRGKTLGRYVVLDRLGQGGMGVVYAAYDPELDRKVAIKLVQEVPGDAAITEGGRARLLREAQAMARLTHPCVISVYDVGTFGDSVFIAMEFVPGRTLTRWLEQARATKTPWRTLLEVFEAAGRGLAAAHAAGIVHRDFKPDNVMVLDADEDKHPLRSRVRVLDFGLARPEGDATDLPRDSADGSNVDPISRSTSSTSMSGRSFDARLTATGAVMGTPAYMAPEQHLGRTADPRTDQFSFCVALWQGLYGSRPFAGESIPELAGNVLRGRIRTPPRGTGVPARVHRVLLRGLCTDPEQRYPSMEALLEDLTADPSRRRRQVATAGVLLAVGGGGFGLAAALGPDRELCQGAQERLVGVWDDEVREQVRTAFETQSRGHGDDLFEGVQQRLDAYAGDWVGAHTRACEATRIRGEQSDADLGLRMTCLDERRERLEALTALLVEADRELVARSLSTVHDLPDIAACEDIETLRLGVKPPSEPQTAREVEALRAEADQVHALASAARYTEALELAESALERMRATGYAPGIAELLGLVGGLHIQIGDRDVGIAALEEGLILAEASGHLVEVVEISSSLALAEAWVRHRHDVGLMIARRAEAVLDRIQAWPLQRARLLAHRAQIEARMSRPEDAVASLQAALAIRREQGRDRTPDALLTYNQLATQLTALERHREARVHLQTALEIGRDELGPLHPDVAATEATMGRLLASIGDDEGAVEHLKRSLEIFEQALGPDHDNVVAVLNGIALTQHGLGEIGEAREAYERCLRILERTDGNKVTLAHVLNNLGLLERDDGASHKAVEYLERSIDLKLETVGPDSEDLAYGRENLGRALRDLGRHDESVEQYRQALQLHTRLHGDSDERPAFARVGLGETLLAAGRLEEAEEQLEIALRVFASDPSADSGWMADGHFVSARVEQARGRPDRAVELARQALLLYLARPDQDEPDRREVERWLAERGA